MSGIHTDMGASVIITEIMTEYASYKEFVLKTRYRKAVREIFNFCPWADEFVILSQMMQLLFEVSALIDSESVTGPPR